MTNSSFFPALGREPEFTTLKKREGGDAKKRCIDYIWYGRDKLELMGVLEVPDEEEIGSQRLPSFSFPSDHIDLFAKFNRV